jgi:hypothetical protein
MDEIRKDLILSLDKNHTNDCECDSFSDCYIDINEIRPKGDWNCESIKEWFKDNYKLTIIDKKEIFVPINGFAN